jgi:DNA-binding response OmpR family regulator
MPATQHNTSADSRYGTETKRILLLEDDQTLQGIIREFLEEQYYEVVAVTNGVDGVRAVMKEDFDAIICDMMMPRLPGDMFYTAVERMRPHLCRRFIFITGHRGNSKINDFIKQVQGSMLPKPFRMDDLLSTLAAIRVTSILH